MGRPSKLTPKTQNRLCDSIRLGAIYEHACNAAGVDYTTFRRWMRQGEGAKSGKFYNFYHAIKKAEGEATDKWLDHIEEAAQEGNWQAAAWKLERRYPASYGKQIVKQQVEQVNLEINWSDLSDDQLKRLANGESILDVMSD